MARTKRRSSSTSSPSPTKNHDNETDTQQPPQDDDDVITPLLSLLSSATSNSLHFLSDHDLLLPPSLSLSLSSALRSSALSLSRLLSLLPHLHLPPSPPPSPSPCWFLRFLNSCNSLSSDPRWLENFRMSKPSFYLLLQTLSPSLHSTSNSSPPPDHTLAAALFRLAHAAPFPFVAHRFGLPSPAAACRAFYHVCKAIANHLGHLFELSSDTNRVLQGFNWMSLPNCCGVLAFSRFPLQSAAGSVLAQALVDSEGRFLDVSAGWHGSMSPAQILTNTKLYTAQSVVLASGGGPSVELSGGTSVPRYFLGGPCCPLLPWLLTPFREKGEELKEVAFNTVHARGMELVDKAFRRVRARWQILKVEWKEDCAEALPFVVVACCLLHNYLIKCSEPMPEEGEGSGMELGFLDFEGKGDEEGERIRELLALHLSQVIRK